MNRLGVASLFNYGLAVEEGSLPPPPELRDHALVNWKFNRRVFIPWASRSEELLTVFKVATRFSLC